jgi:hypothetical protein
LRDVRVVDIEGCETYKGEDKEGCEIYKREDMEGWGEGM